MRRRPAHPPVGCIGHSLADYPPGGRISESRGHGLAAQPATGIFGQSVANTPMGWIRAPVSRNRLIALRSVSCRVTLSPHDQQSSLTAASVSSRDTCQASWATTVSDHVLGAGTRSPIDRTIATWDLIAERPHPVR